MWVYVLLGAGAGIFWVYAVYHYSVILFTLIERRRRKSQSEAQAPSGNAEPPRVALLYTTADDFIEEAALTCVRQDYPRFHVFLLDDSRTEQAKSEVDRFHEQHPSATTVLRRADRRGFKAGNLNNFLSTMGQDFDFFAVSDSDGILPTHFLSTGIAYFDRYSSLGFVQANHYSVVQPSSSFARAFSDEAKIRWEYNNLPRNRFGLPLFLGPRCHRPLRGVLRRWRLPGGRRRGSGLHRRHAQGGLLRPLRPRHPLWRGIPAQPLPPHPATRPPDHG